MTDLQHLRGLKKIYKIRCLDLLLADQRDEEYKDIKTEVEHLAEKILELNEICRGQQ